MTMNSVQASDTILIVDDSDDDYDATVRALTGDGHLKNPIHRCTDGQETLDYLYRRRGYADAAPRPGIILLDLNMPGLDGFAVLKAIKGDDRLRHIPTVVMTHSDDECDINDCYDIGANTYVQKPFNWPSFLKAMTRLREYWFDIAQLPRSA